MHHLVRFYYTSVPSPPAFFLRNSSSFESISLQLNRPISIKFVERRCIGYRGVSGYFPCPNNAINIKQCPTCMFRDISKVYTRMDTSGYEGMEEKFKNRIVSIYLASFGPLVKVGVSENPERRVYEQGADFWVRIMSMRAEEAYPMEQVIKERFGLLDAINAKKKIAVLGLDVNPLPEIIEKILSDKLISPYLTSHIKIKKNDFIYPANSTKCEKDISGVLCGWKGPFLFFSDNNKNFFVDMKSKEGFVVRMNEM